MDPLVATVLSAAEQGHKQRLATLLRENPAMAEACDEEGSTPLMYAAANGRENVLSLLVQVYYQPTRVLACELPTDFLSAFLPLLSSNVISYPRFPMLKPLMKALSVIFETLYRIILSPPLSLSFTRTK